MGLWAGIKHALNSTLGTAKFKPLDKIFKESMYLVASDTPIYNIGNVSGSQNAEKTIFEKTINVDGTIRFIASGTTTLSLGHDYFKIYKNNGAVKTLAKTTSGEQTFSADITVEKGSTIKLTLYTVDSGKQVENVQLCGFVTLAPDDGIFLE